MSHGFAYFFRSNGFSHVSSIYVIESSKKGNNILVGFYWSLPFEPLLLDGLMSSNDGFPYAYAKKYDYISPIHLWIEEVLQQICKPWHDFIFLPHDHDRTSDFDRRKVNKMPTYAYLILDVSLFWFVTKHKVNFKVSLNSLNGYIGFMILLSMLCLLC
jgi:hypothetical protein